MHQMEEMALDVAVNKTSKTGVFIVSEPENSVSQSAKNRLKLEKELSIYVLQQLWESGEDGEINNDITINDVIKVLSL